MLLQVIAYPWIVQPLVLVELYINLISNSKYHNNYGPWKYKGITPLAQAMSKRTERASLESLDVS